MPRITRSALVMFSAEQMFRLVNDVHAYPEFLPGCVGSRVHESGEDYMMASVDVAKAGIAKTFTTRNRLDANRAIKMELVEGPFSKLAGWWTFTPLDVLDLRLNAGIYNLGDKRYWDYSSTRSLQPGVARDRRDIELLSNPGRTFAVSMNVAF